MHSSGLHSAKPGAETVKLWTGDLPDNPKGSPRTPCSLCSTSAASPGAKPRLLPDSCWIRARAESCSLPLPRCLASRQTIPGQPSAVLEQTQHKPGLLLPHRAQASPVLYHLAGGAWVFWSRAGTFTGWTRTYRLLVVLVGLQSLGLGVFFAPVYLPFLS